MLFLPAQCKWHSIMTETCHLHLQCWNQHLTVAHCTYRQIPILSLLDFRPDTLYQCQWSQRQLTISPRTNEKTPLLLSDLSRHIRYQCRILWYTFRKRFSSDHLRLWRSKPWSRIVESTTKVELTTVADCQSSLQPTLTSINLQVPLLVRYDDSCR